MSRIKGNTPCIFLLSHFVITAGLIGCSSDTTAPGNSNGNPTETVEAEGSIGSDGGNLAGDNLTIEVPAGAWSESENIRIVRDDSLNPFDSADPAPVIIVEGIPTDFDQPLTLRYRRKAGSDSPPSLAIGEEAFSPTIGNAEMSYRIFSIDVPDTSSWLTCQLDPADSRKSGQPGRDKDRTMFVNITERIHAKNYVSEAGHFNVSYTIPFTSDEQAEEFGAYLEEAYTKVADLGFSYAARIRWPVSVTIKSMGSTLWGASYNSMFGDNYGYLEFNTDKFSSMAEMRIAAGHEFFHLAQALYDPRSAYNKADSGGPHYWLDEASSVWFEDRFTDQGDYISMARNGSEYVPFEGAEKGIEGSGDVQSYGYSMAALLKHLLAQAGEDRLRLVYEKILTGKNPFEAIEESFGTTMADIWGEFTQQYAAGEIYKDVTRTLLKTARSGSFNIETSTDTLATFTNDFKKLSARVYFVDLSYADISEDAKLSIETSGGDTEIRVYKYQGLGDLELINDKISTTILSDLHGLTTAGYNLVVLVANKAGSLPFYSGNDAINIYLRVLSNPDLSRFETAIFRIRYEVTWLNGDGSTNTVVWQYLNSSSQTGTWNGFTYRADWDIPGDDMDETGYIEITLNPIDLHVVSFTTRNMRDYTSQGTYTLYESEGHSLADPDVSSDQLRYSVSGEESCSFLTGVYVESYIDGELNQKTQSFTCNDDSYITLTLRDDLP